MSSQKHAFRSIKHPHALDFQLNTLSIIQSLLLALLEIGRKCLLAQGGKRKSYSLEKKNSVELVKFYVM